MVESFLPVIRPGLEEVGNLTFVGRDCGCCTDYTERRDAKKALPELPLRGECLRTDGHDLNRAELLSQEVSMRVSMVLRCPVIHIICEGVSCSHFLWKEVRRGSA